MMSERKELKIETKQTTIYEAGGQVFTDIVKAQQYLDSLTENEINEMVFIDEYSNKAAIHLEDFLVLSQKFKAKKIIDSFKEFLKNN
jgi:hypothetical protein